MRPHRRRRGRRLPGGWPRLSGLVLLICPRNSARKEAEPRGTRAPGCAASPDGACQAGRLRRRDSENGPPLCWGLPVCTQVRVLLILNQLIQKPVESRSQERVPRSPGPPDVSVLSLPAPRCCAPGGAGDPQALLLEGGVGGYSDRTAAPRPPRYARTGPQALRCDAAQVSRRRRRQRLGSGVRAGPQHGRKGPSLRRGLGSRHLAPGRGAFRAPRRGNSRELSALDSRTGGGASAFEYPA